LDVIFTDLVNEFGRRLNNSTTVFLFSASVTIEFATISITHFGYGGELVGTENL
jgi:hypothetical protein